MLMIVLTYNRIIIRHSLCAKAAQICKLVAFLAKLLPIWAVLAIFCTFLRTFYGPKYDLLKIKYGGVTKLIDYIKYGNICNEERGMSYLTIF